MKDRRILALVWVYLAVIPLTYATPDVVARAESWRVLPPGESPQDRRLGPLRSLDDYSPFHPCDSPEAWAVRAERIRRQLLVATGLWPLPTKTPARAVVHGKEDRGAYTVEKVYLESFPGHFVTGTLYRPKGQKGKRPGVLSPHGHWGKGRFYEASEKKIGQEIATGAERFEYSGRFPIQARCVQLARMGCVVFSYDMLGNADSIQLEHRPGVRPEMNTAQDWGYFSPQAELRLQTMMGLQTYNSIRALDWLSGLEDVDATRIGVTGSSGGGTQTLILCAVDPRPTVSFPAVMVSTAMQGGCTCENACYLRLGTGNVEIAALFAPKPLGMTAADDWTQEIETKGLPELRQHYRMLGAEDLVMARHFSFPHNYNYVSRSVMYDWFNTHLGLGLPAPIVEEDFRPENPQEMSVWDDEHPKPPSGPQYERSLLRWITEDSRKQMAALVPSDAESLEHYRRIVGGAVDIMIGRSVPHPGAKASCGPVEDLGDSFLLKLLVCNDAEGEQVPTLFLQPKQWNREVVIWVDKGGKQALFNQQGEPREAIRRLLEAGMAVVGVDLFGQGELTHGTPINEARINDRGRGNWGTYAGYTFGYNYPDFSKRVQDILSVISFVKNSQWAVKNVNLVGLAGAGHWVAAARAQAGGAVGRAVVDTGGFRFADITDVRHVDFLPGGAKYLDLPGMMALSAPHELWLAGEGAEVPPVVSSAYLATAHPDRLFVFTGQKKEQEMAALEWLLR